MNFKNSLNKKQLQAVQHKKGPLLILAGAGSGKTRVLTYRLAYLLKQGLYPEQIMAVTFTNKAADEMKERVKKLVGEETIPFLGTFHSISVKILRQELNQLDLPWNSDFVIYDQDDSQKLISEIINDLKLDKDRYKAKKIKTVISSNKQENIGPEMFESDDFYYSKVKKIYKIYQKRLAESNAMDFDDLLLNFLKVLENYSQIREKYQKRFKHILVDEYQDTNLVQYKIVNILADYHNNIAVVGDDWQSIYRFRGADYRNILKFNQDYPKAKVVKLEQNYRSTSNIVKAAQAVIRNNDNRSKKELWTDNKEGDKVAIIQSETADQEASRIAQLVNKISDLKETVILYRTHAQSRLIEEALLYHQIPYQIIGGLRFYQRKEIKDIIAYLWLVENSNPIHFLRAVNTPRRGIGKVTQEKIKKTDYDLSKIDNKRVESFKKLLKKLKKEAGKKTIDQLITWLIDEINYFDYLKSFSQSEEQLEYRRENIDELIAVSSKYSKLKPKKSLKAFLEEVSLMDSQDRLDEEKEKLTLMTLHNAKGLEFENVIMSGLEQGLFPHKNSLESKKDLEEERRLCYVGMTRAKQKLYLSWAQARYMFGQLEAQDPSTFLSEIPDNNKKTLDFAESQPLSNVENFNQKLEPGDWIKHLKLGRAKVVSVDEEMIKVKFPKLGEKNLSLEYAPIKKI